MHDVVFVATEHDTIYAIDASSGTVLWQRSFLDTSVPENNTLGATAISTLTTGDVGTSDIQVEIGITGTPVIDANSGTIFVVAKTKETIGGTNHFVQRLHALNIGDGTDRVAPLLLGDTFGGNSNNTPIYVYGGGDGHVTDPYNSTGQQVVQFNALREHQRGALSLVNNTIYIPWASHGDNGPYHGWVAAIDVSQLATNGLQLKGVLCSSPNDGLAGIWQGGGASYIRSGRQRVLLRDRQRIRRRADAEWQRLPKQRQLQQSAGQGRRRPHHHSQPAERKWLGHQGRLTISFRSTSRHSTAPTPILAPAHSIILPDSAGIAGHPHLMVAGGKEGKLYVVDRDNLGHFDANNDQVLNAIPDGSGHNTPPNLINGLLSTPAWFNDKLYAVSGYSGHAIAFALNSTGQLSAVSQTGAGSFGYLPGSPMVSADGSANGIVWMMDRQTNRLHAYDASTWATELWNSGQRPAILSGLSSSSRLPRLSTGWSTSAPAIAC